MGREGGGCFLEMENNTSLLSLSFSLSFRKYTGRQEGEGERKDGRGKKDRKYRINARE